MKDKFIFKNMEKCIKSMAEKTFSKKIPNVLVKNRIFAIETYKTSKI